MNDKLESENTAKEIKIEAIEEHSIQAQTKLRKRNVELETKHKRLGEQLELTKSHHVIVQKPNKIIYDIKDFKQSSKVCKEIKKVLPGMIMMENKDFMIGAGKITTDY